MADTVAPAGEMKRRLTLTGVTVNAMALIAPGAFLWTTFQVQAALSRGGTSTAPDMWTGLEFALVPALLTAYSYSEQAEFFLESYDIDGVINLHLPDEEVHRRVLARRLCSQCGMDYNLIAHRPQNEDTCDVCQGRLVARADDNPEALAVRLSAHHEQTRPLIEIFQRKEYVATVDATRPVHDVQFTIRERFELPDFNAAYAT